MKILNPVQDDGSGYRREGLYMYFSRLCHPEFISESSDNLEQDWKMLK